MMVGKQTYCNITEPSMILMEMQKRLILKVKPITKKVIMQQRYTLHGNIVCHLHITLMDAKTRIANIIGAKAL